MAVRQRNNSRVSSHPAIIVSACLAGIACAYKGGAKLDVSIKKMVDTGCAIPVCPEVMGGLTTPRENAEIVGGDGADVFAGRARVLSIAGKDVTPRYLAGARAVLDIARRHGITKAILKSKSPACGCGLIYDGTFTRTLRPGHGVLTALLLKHRLVVRTEHDL